MGGLVLDIYLEFLIRFVMGKVRKARSRSWPTVTATVSGAFMESGFAVGGQVVRVRYTYEIEGENYSGVHSEPFLVKGLGEDYIHKFPAESGTPVRVKPNDPSKSVLVRG